MGATWNSNELTLVVKDYFNMLEMELRGVSFNKAEHNRNLRLKLNGRSKGSVEFKHQNISAVLQQLGKIYIFGYKPLRNFQNDLLEAVVSYLERQIEIENAFRLFAEEQVTSTDKPVDYSSWKDSMPPMLTSEPIPKAFRRRVNNTNWLVREEQNRAIGFAGEELVYNYEVWRLASIGKDALAQKVEWTAEEKGDGAGYDIRSYNADGTDRYIEVKTTKLGNTAPIFFSRNELEVSQELGNAYNLCRVFQLTRKPKMFEASGSLDQICPRVEAHSFKGYF